MDPMVIKYLAIAAIVYGTQAMLAISQIVLCVYLVASGILHLSSKEKVGKWAAILGLVITPKIKQKSWMSWLMIATGIAFILPLLGLSYWIAVIACVIAIYCILSLTTGLGAQKEKQTGTIMRKGLALSAILIFGFTIWEGRDLVYVGFDVNYKAIYWRHLEVTVWQQDHNPNVPKVGEVAPDFELTDYTGTKTVRLSDFRGKKPVVLFFGSFT
jgi:AhpC/TSA family